MLGATWVSGRHAYCVIADLQRTYRHARLRSAHEQDSEDNSSAAGRDARGRLDTWADRCGGV